MFRIRLEAPGWIAIWAWIAATAIAYSASAAELPAAPLPETNGTVEIPAQEWPLKPGPRTVKVFITYPGGQLANVKPTTGLMLTLHNWGGYNTAGTASPTTLADHFNVVAIAVDYLQSGDKATNDIAEPYDYGYLQALDALRALELVFTGLDAKKIPF